MNRNGKVGARFLLAVVGLLAWGASWAEGGGWARRRASGVVPTAAAAPMPTSYDPSPYPMLGTFYPTPFLISGAYYPVEGGISWIGAPSSNLPKLYGPLSPFRAYSAPVVTYARGYDGRPVVLEGTSFSTPNRPDMTPVVYPTQANYYYRIRATGDPPWWASGMNWIDQN